MLKQGPGSTTPLHPLQYAPESKFHMFLQGEAYEEDDSCAAVDQTHVGVEGESAHDAPMYEETPSPPSNSGLEWQQAFDPMYGCFYYYRESTQVCSKAVQTCCNWLLGYYHTLKHSLPALSQS